MFMFLSQFSLWYISFDFLKINLWNNCWALRNHISSIQLTTLVLVVLFYLVFKIPDITFHIFEILKNYYFAHLSYEGSANSFTFCISAPERWPCLIFFNDPEAIFYKLFFKENCQNKNKQNYDKVIIVVHG